MRRLLWWVKQDVIPESWLENQQTRLLTTLLVVLIALGTVSATVQLVAVPGFARSFAVVMAAVGLLAIALALLRSGAYRAAAAITSGLPCIAALGAAASNPTDTTALAFVSLGIGFATMLLSRRAALALSAAAIAGTLALHLIQPALPVDAIIAAAAFNTIATVLLVVAARHRDALEAHRLAEQERLHDQLRRCDRLASLGILAAGIAHEVANPLTVVSANLSILGKHSYGPVAGSSVSSAQQGITRIMTIVRGLTSFARGGDGSRKEASVRDALESALEMASAQIRSRARLIRDYEGTPTVRADSALLEQVFLNLLLNAVQAIPEVSPSAHEVRVSIRSVDDLVEVSVADTGEGIPADQVAQIFEPFVTTKKRPESTGLGLSISREIVTALGGRIEVESQVGTGTTFRVSLPAVVRARPMVQG